MADIVEVTVDTDLNDEDQGIDALIVGHKWDLDILSFSFPDDYSDLPYGYNMGSFYAMSESFKVAARAALDSVSAYIDLDFYELSGAEDRDAKLRFSGDYDLASIAMAYDTSMGGDLPGGMSYGLDYVQDSPTNVQVGDKFYAAILHEIGHTLGLKHGHDTVVGGALPAEYDSHEFSVMTYHAYIGATGGRAPANGSSPQSMMMLDIAALQRLYGADFETNSGDTVYSFDSAGKMYVDGVDVIAQAGLTKTSQNKIFRTIWDGNGNDTYDFSNYTTNISVDLAPGGFVDLDIGGIYQRAKLNRDAQNTNPGEYDFARGHVFNALLFEDDLRSLIENAEGGSGNDLFFGNAGDNEFRGNGGADTFHDSEGSDSYIGGDGDDTVKFEGAFDSYVITTNGTALLVSLGGDADHIWDDVETVQFSDQAWAFADLWDHVYSGANAPPVAEDDSAETDQDTEIIVSVLDNDSDPDGDALIVSSATNGNNGITTVNADGTITYTPDDGFFGTDSFEYTIQDGNGGESTASVDVVVNEVEPVLVATPVFMDFEGYETGRLNSYADLDFSTLFVKENSQINGDFLAQSNRDGEMSISSQGEDFDLESIVLRSNNNVSRSVNVYAYDDGQLVDSQVVIASKTPTEIVFDFDSVDEVRFDADGRIRFDDLNLVTYAVDDGSLGV